MRFNEESVHFDTESVNPSNGQGGSHPYPGAGLNIDIEYCYYYG